MEPLLTSSSRSSFEDTSPIAETLRGSFKAVLTLSRALPLYPIPAEIDPDQGPSRGYFVIRVSSACFHPTKIKRERGGTARRSASVNDDVTAVAWI